MDINFTLDDDDARRIFDDLERSLNDQAVAWANVGEYLIAKTKDHFLDGIGPDGKPWARKAKSTILNYQLGPDRHSDPRPLFGPSGRLHSDIFSESSADGVSWGSNREYASVMQFGAAKGAFGSMSNGSKIPWGDIPARPFIGLSYEDEINIKSILAEWLQEAVDP